MLKIAFRVDASPQIGTGHFMRCLTLADALRRDGAKIRFVYRQLPDHFLLLLKRGGHEYSPMPHDPPGEPDRDLRHGGWLGTSRAHDAAQTIHALADGSWDWLIVDHYALDARWESALRGSARMIAVIDDIADRAHDCDLLLDQNLQAGSMDRYAGKVPNYCRKLLGPRYALLREEFRVARERATPRDGPVRRVLIFFGGVDADNLTGHAIEAVAGLAVSGMHVDVVIGARHPYGTDIAAQCRLQGFTCHVQTERMAELIAAAELAIGAGGTAVWERCCLGLPALTICVAENQQEQIAAAADAGLVYAPEYAGAPTSFIQRHTRALMENRLLRRSISDACLLAVDGRGSGRVAATIAGGDLEIRRATAEDSRNLFAWRNDPGVRQVSRSSDVIEWGVHQEWLAAVLASADRHLLIGEHQGSPVGVVRFDVKGDEAEISIYLVPGAQPFGRGRRLLQCSERWLAANCLGVRRIQAEVLAGNERSKRLFLGAGYHCESAIYSKRLDHP
jgi:UDP-2,4-diacetamido-2,4,6-trideoxy-beta-L-altropyranose hydrolase